MALKVGLTSLNLDGISADATKPSRRRGSSHPSVPKRTHGSVTARANLYGGLGVGGGRVLGNSYKAKPDAYPKSARNASTVAAQLQAQTWPYGSAAVDPGKDYLSFTSPIRSPTKPEASAFYKGTAWDSGRKPHPSSGRRRAKSTTTGGGRSRPGSSVRVRAKSNTRGNKNGRTLLGGASAVRKAKGNRRSSNTAAPSFAMWKVGKEMAHYTVGKTIGEGTFGKVKEGIHKATGESVAIKILEKHRIVELADVERVEREIHILKTLNHSNCVRLLEVIDTKEAIFLIMEYASSGELFDYIVTQGRVKESEVCVFMHQMLNGLDDCHRRGVAHRDLKPENVLLSPSTLGPLLCQSYSGGPPKVVGSGLMLKLVDFGLGNIVPPGSLMKTACGSPCYAAPEMIEGMRYHGSAVDIWSMGVIFYALLCGYLPFEEQSTAALYDKIVNGIYDIPSHVSLGARDLLQKILCTDPRQRYNAEQIRKHPWYSSLTFPTDPEILADTEDTSVNIHPEVIRHMLELDSELDVETILTELQERRHNNVTATYHLLAAKLRRRGSKLESLSPKTHRSSLLELSSRMSTRDNSVEADMSGRSTGTDAKRCDGSPSADEDEKRELRDSVLLTPGQVHDSSPLPLSTPRRHTDVSGLSSVASPMNVSSLARSLSYSEDEMEELNHGSTRRSSVSRRVIDPVDSVRGTGLDNTTKSIDISAVTSPPFTPSVAAQATPKLAEVGQVVDEANTTAEVLYGPTPAKSQHLAPLQGAALPAAGVVTPKVQSNSGVETLLDLPDDVERQTLPKIEVTPRLPQKTVSEPEESVIPSDGADTATELPCVTPVKNLPQPTRGEDATADASGTLEANEQPAPPLQPRPPPKPKTELPTAAVDANAEGGSEDLKKSRARPRGRTQRAAQRLTEALEAKQLHIHSGLNGASAVESETKTSAQRMVPRAPPQPRPPTGGAQRTRRRSSARIRRVRAGSANPSRLASGGRAAVRSLSQGKTAQSKTSVGATPRSARRRGRGSAKKKAKA